MIGVNGCKKKNPEPESLVLSQKDIDLLITHKQTIDKITGKYDVRIAKMKKGQAKEEMEKGKKEINDYLISKGLSPVPFMRKSKKILKGYLAFKESGEDALERKMKQHEHENFTEKEYQAKKEYYKKSQEALFNDLTSELSDYEIQLIRSNLVNISKVVK